jgi:hypothetical protein
VTALLVAWNLLVAWDIRFVIWMPLLGFLFVSLGFGLITGGLLVALERYRLYDADAAISRSTAFALLSGLLALVFALSSTVLDWLFAEMFAGKASLLPETAGVVAGLVVIAPSHDWLTRWAERRFRKPLVELREGLPDCLAKLCDLTGTTELVDEILSRVVQALRPRRAALLIGDTPSGLWEANIGEVEQWFALAKLDETALDVTIEREDHFFPVRVPLRLRGRVGETPLGWLLLGPRPDRSLYGKDEREALSAIAAPAARALKAVLLREQRDGTIATRLASLEAWAKQVGEQLSETAASPAARRARQPGARPKTRNRDGRKE